jgi:hypothetical protein
MYEVNEYCHDLKDAELKGLILQVTGLEDGNRVVQLTQGTFSKIKKHANFDGVLAEEIVEEPTATPEKPTLPPDLGGLKRPGFSIGYTINLNLPASTNIEVFNAIFKSLKENLLRDN